MLTQTISSQIIYVENQINLIQSNLSNLPEGQILVTRNKRYFKWFQKTDSGLVYLPHSQKNLAKLLALKKYLLLKLEELMKERLYLQKLLQITPASTQLLNDDRYSMLISNAINDIYRTNISNDTINEWINQPYKSNTKYPEQLICKSLSGNILRSKSEAFIDMSLFSHNIPFRYECALELDDTTFYPDFTIMHPKTFEIYYWEHFGLMDNPAYVQNTISKLDRYASHGYIPTINLITTYETKNYPLSCDTVDKIIKHYFLE